MDGGGRREASSESIDGVRHWLKRGVAFDLLQVSHVSDRRRWKRRRRHHRRRCSRGGGRGGCWRRGRRRGGGRRPFTEQRSSRISSDGLIENLYPFSQRQLERFEGTKDALADAAPLRRMKKRIPRRKRRVYLNAVH